MKYIPLSETGYFSKIILDYVNNDPVLRPFYGARPEEAELILKAKKKKISKAQRDILADVLSSQYIGIDTSSSVHNNIGLLRESNTFSVTTGHQLNLFTGPLYAIYKIAQTIKLAQQLKAKDPDNNYVPIYWMASEDHDQAEVNHAFLLNEKLEWNVEGNDAVGRISTSRTAEVLGQLKDLLEKFNFPINDHVWIIESYRNSKDLSEASRRFVDHLFNEYGLLIIDGDNAKLKETFAHILIDELENQTSSGLVTETIESFPSEYKVQVNPRDINLFYLSDGNRERIIRTSEGAFSAGEKTIARDLTEIKVMVHDHPEKFSPNVVLRPLFQEYILPNIAYVGGGGELAYWFEYKTLFEHYAIDFPILLLRNSILILDSGSMKKIEKLGLEVNQLFTDTDHLIRDFVKEEDGDKLSLSKEIAEISDIFSNLIEKATQIDRSLTSSFEAEKLKQFKLLHQLEEKLIRASKKKHETEVNQIRGLKEKLFPGNSLQERHDNFLNFYLKHPNCISEIMDQIEPLKMEFGIMELN